MDQIDQLANEQRPVQITVELQRHIGETVTPLGPFNEELNQWRVFVSSSISPEKMFIGYLPHDPKGKFCPYTTWHRFPKPLQDTILEKISEEAGNTRQLGNVPIDPNSDIGRQFLRTGTIPDKTDDEDDGDDTETVDE